MSLEWKNLLEILLGSFAGAAAVVGIDYLIRYHLNKIRNFREAISIQLALHQMLVVLLQMRTCYDKSMQAKIEFYKTFDGENSENLWRSFRHIDFPAYLQFFDIVNLDWNFTQFLSKNEGKIRDIVKCLIPAKLGYQSIINILFERNKLLFEIQPVLDKFVRDNSSIQNVEYQNNNLLNAIGNPAYFRLKSLTDSFIEKIDGVIEDCYKSFMKLSEFIKDGFCGYSPLKLDIKDNNLNSALQRIIKSKK